MSTRPSISDDGRGGRLQLGRMQSRFRGTADGWFAWDDRALDALTLERPGDMLR